MICESKAPNLSKLIICIVGMPGAGKSTIARGLDARGFTVVSMGDAVRAEADRRNLEPTSENLGALMLEIRKRGGAGAVADLVAPQILNAAQDTVVVDGVRSGAEIDALRRAGMVRVLLVHASVDTRFGHLSRRKRSDDPLARRSFQERDWRELGVGISAPIALADEAISNNNTSIDELNEAAYKIVSRWVRQNEAAEP